MKDYEEARSGLEALIQQRGITVTSKGIARRSPPWEGQDDFRRLHYQFEVHCRTLVFAGEYSQGCQPVLDALKFGYKGPSGSYHPLMIGSVGYWDSNTVRRILEGKAKPWKADMDKWCTLMHTFANKLPPDPLDIVWALLMDGLGSDVPFDEWTSELGYSNDSIKALTMWEKCNETRRAMSKMFGIQYDEALDFAGRM